MYSRLNDLILLMKSLGQEPTRAGFSDNGQLWSHNDRIGVNFMNLRVDVMINGPHLHNLKQGCWDRFDAKDWDDAMARLPECIARLLSGTGGA